MIWGSRRQAHRCQDSLLDHSSIVKKNLKLTPAFGGLVGTFTRCGGSSLKGIIMILFRLDIDGGERILMADTPYYSLEEIRRLLKNPDTRIITRRDRREAAALGYADDDEMVGRVLQVTLDEFKKKMEAEEMPGYWQDVYNSVEPDGSKLYIKLQIREGSGVIISFKRK